MKKIILLTTILFLGSLFMGLQAQTNYLLKIANTLVTSDNAQNIIGDGISGTVTYDNSSKTLTLNEATIVNESGRGIFSQIDGLTVNLIGENNINCSSDGCVFRENTTIAGAGRLTTTSATECGIYFFLSLNISGGCTIIASGPWAITGLSGSQETLTINASTVKATGSHGSVRDIQSLTLTDCEITQPEGAEFSPQLKGIALNGALVTTEVIISNTNVSVESEIDANALITVFPNPVSRILHVQAKTPIEDIEILDVSGRKVLSLQAKRSDVEIDVSDLPNGIYIVKTITANDIQTCKIVKQN